jgi:hypothetical protein
MSVKMVEQYCSAESFDKGLNKAQNNGWILDSWQMVRNGRGYLIVAVYRGR